MIPKGTMLPLKKILGAVVGIGGFLILTNFELAVKYKTIFGIASLVSAYFLLKSGRQL